MTDRSQMLVEQARAQMRLYGPQVEVNRSFGIRHCRKCNPEPELFKCPVCDSTFEERWQFRVHLESNSELCQQWGRRKERAWAARD